MKNSALVVFATACAAGSVSAAPLLYDGFDGLTPGIEIDDAGFTGTGWSGPWGDDGAFGTGSFLASATGLGYTSGTDVLVTNGGSTVSDGRSPDVRNVRVYNAGSVYANGSEVWASFLINVEQGAAARVFPFSRFQNLLNGVGFTSTTSGSIGLRAIVGGAFTDSDFVPIPFGETHFVVGRFLFRDGAPDEMAMWVNPSLAAAPSLADAVTLSVDLNLDSNWDQWFIRGAGAASLFLDEFRMGATFADVAPVVPSPGVPLLVLAGTALASRRQR